MQKLFKKIAVLLTAVIAVLGIAVFATACDDKGNSGDNTKYATAGSTIKITVVDENGDPINGPTFGVDEWSGATMNAQAQFCSYYEATGTLGMCASPVDINAQGIAILEYDAIKSNADNSTPAATKVELHILFVEEAGYEKDYGVYDVNKIPTEITVTLKLKTNG